MALNFSPRPIFPTHTSEDNIVSPLRIVNGEKVGHEFDKSGSPESVSKDIIDLLPSDPFGMDIDISDISTTFTAITGWLGDLELEYRDYMRNTYVNHKEDYGLFADFSLFLNSAMKFQSIQTDFMFHEYDCNRVNDVVATCRDVGEPHDAFVLALSYLGTKDLLAVERVCKSLCVTVHNDSLLWRNLYIDQPLNERITDDVLVELTNRAEGNLQCLSLIKCPKITDDGLRRVLETNPKITKLFIPGCTRLSIEGILNNLKAFNANTETAGIKQIKTGGFYGITLDHYKVLSNLLGIQKTSHVPNYYHRANSCHPCDDERALDVEICPRCENLRLVYDCPAGGCHPKEQCRACIICIPRCAECGRCVHNSEYEETFSLEYLCSECLKQLPVCEESRG
ncbi:F-box protein SKIP14-like [Bidens hawaiensis]|uniref:F-box protein SKIP14-like n=1 Tax=Bidens hawaiensis TaxID=980011 RepID=UPI0040499E59